MIQLKVRTEYSFGQTFAPIKKVIKRLKAIGCTAAGIVDRSTWGHVAWHKACEDADIQPLLGVEVCVADDDITHRMWFLARNKAGLGEIYRLMSKSHLQPIATKVGSVPRLYRRDVLGMSKNVIKFAGDITDGKFLKQVGAYIDLSPASRILNIKKQAIALEYKLNLVSTSDNAFSAPEDVKVFELISRGGLKQTPQYILPELEHQDTAKKIAKLCSKLELPVAPMIRAEGNLEELCRKGIKLRGMEHTWSSEYEERLVYELDLIQSKDFESYFIIVADMVNYAKQHMLVGPSRGSAAGSLVCYLSRITEIDPIPPRLYFERFIDVTRKDLPDIDLDFPDNKRDMVFKYMSGKYGLSNVAHIGAINKFKPKSALIQVCKALNIPPSATASVKVAMIERSMADARASNCLGDTFNDTKPGQEFIAAYPQAIAAGVIEGHASHTSVHAAGLLVCNDEITNYATIDAEGIAHIEKGAAEKLGLLKIDVLGLRTLGLLDDAGVPVDWYNLKFDDKKTFDVFNQQRFCGIFQFEGNALRSISSQINFNSIIEIDAVTALARPGPFATGVTEEYIKRKMHNKKYKIIHPLVESYMDETFGLPIYQEQTMAIVRYIGKFSWDDTSSIRKAISKTMGREYFDAFWPKFKRGSAENGIDEATAKEIWRVINAMGSWQMNKAHTFSYAVISYWTAYLKANFPLEFAAANLRNAKDEDSAVELLREMVGEGVEYTAFDIDRSELNWSVKEGKLLGGFLSLKGIGVSKATKLIEARKAGALTQKQKDGIVKAENIFSDLFPLQTKYGNLYNDPFNNDIASEVVHIKDFDTIPPHAEERVFIGELVYKNPRNANEDANVKKRNGQLETGQLEYCDVRLRDDTATIGGRIGRKDYLQIGVQLIENIPVGAHLLIRAAFYNGIRYAFIKKWKRLDV